MMKWYQMGLSENGHHPARVVHHGSSAFSVVKLFFWVCPVVWPTQAAAVIEFNRLNAIECYLALLHLVRPTEYELTDWRNAPPISEQVRPEDDLPKSSWVKTVARLQTAGWEQFPVHCNIKDLTI